MKFSPAEILLRILQHPEGGVQALSSQESLNRLADKFGKKKN